MKINPVVLAAIGLCASLKVMADIRFEEVTAGAGIHHKGQSYGASWGDFNNDGWPDLWVGNHNSKPSLYQNMRDGRFTDIIDEVWTGNEKSDTHGAEWADFDNDGDQDLVEVVGALENADGTFCFGCGRNHLFVNQDKVLVEKANALGLGSIGLARSPLWFDADHDGRLDLLVVNTRGGNNLPTSTVFLQIADGFKASNIKLAFIDGHWSRYDKYWGMLYNALRFNFNPIGLLNTQKHLEFAQLADLTDVGRPALVLFSSPTRVYSIDDVPFTDITASMPFPSVDMISDISIEDFDGDGKLDMYLARGPWFRSDVVQTNPEEIRGTLTGHGVDDPRALFFKAEGKLDVQLNPTWLSPSKIYIGPNGRHPDNRTFSLSRDESVAVGSASKVTPQGSGGVSIAYDRESGNWVLSNSLNGEYVDYIINAVQPITFLRTTGFEPFREEGADALLIRGKEAYATRTLSGDAGAPTSCFSVAAGDFDNDMDMDLYLVCTGPVRNIANRLLENDGKGNFHLVPAAGGAEGSILGRGDTVAIADYDLDGFLDLFLTNGTDPTGPFVKDGPHQLYHNVGNNNHWLEIDLEGVQSNRDGIGASVMLEAGGVRQIREQRGGMHRITQNNKQLHFGLGRNTRVDLLTIRWPSGAVSKIQNISSDHILKIRETGEVATSVTSLKQAKSE